MAARMFGTVVTRGRAVGGRNADGAKPAGPMASRASAIYLDGARRAARRDDRLWQARLFAEFTSRETDVNIIKLFEREATQQTPQAFLHFFFTFFFAHLPFFSFFLHFASPFLFLHGFEPVMVVVVELLLLLGALLLPLQLLLLLAGVAEAPRMPQQPRPVSTSDTAVSCRS